VSSATLFVQPTGQPFAPVFETRRDHFKYDVVAAALDIERDAKEDRRANAAP
jgi:hypothetical protein